MKRVLSCLLIILILISLSVPAFADTGCKCGITPIVYVHGFGSYSLYEYSDNGSKTQVFPPDGPAIIKSIPTICDLLVNLTVTKNHKRSANEFIKALDERFDEYYIFDDVSTSRGLDVFICSSDYDQINGLLKSFKNTVIRFKSQEYVTYSVYIYKDAKAFKNTSGETPHSYQKKAKKGIK